MVRRRSPLCSLEEIMEDLDGIDEFHVPGLEVLLCSSLLIYQFCIRISIQVSYSYIAAWRRLHASGNFGYRNHSRHPVLTMPSRRNGLVDLTARLVGVRLLLPCNICVTCEIPDPFFSFMCMSALQSCDYICSTNSFPCMRHSAFFFCC